MTIIYLRMVYIYKILAKKFCETRIRRNQALFMTRNLGEIKLKLRK